MKITVVGATGPTGLQIVQQALAQGHEVTALVRNPDRLELQHDRLHVIKGDVFNPDSIIYADLPQIAFYNSH